MKELNKYLLSFVPIIAFILILAESNYQQARMEAITGEGTDDAIEMTYYRHGFNIEALDTTIPTLSDKFSALLKIKHQKS